MLTDRSQKLIESDAFPFEFVSRLGERESWRKEIYRPIYHLHKWWAKRLGSVFRSALLGSALPENADLPSAYYGAYDIPRTVVLDPFMGSGTTVGEAHKLGMIALGCDINPVAAESVRVAFGELNRRKLQEAFDEVSQTVGKELVSLYRAVDATGQPCDVLYYFWVMLAHCTECGVQVQLFPSYVFARNAYPSRKPDVKILCPSCGNIISGLHSQTDVSCDRCGVSFNPERGPARGQHASCLNCGKTFSILASISRRQSRPPYRLYAKLVVTNSGRKEYLPATDSDRTLYYASTAALHAELANGSIRLPTLLLEDGHNTAQAISYGFRSWRDFFNDRQLLALGRLQASIARIRDEAARDALLTLFSGALEFNNLFASYKGEGTGAVRHMFSHHILKPERTPIEANVWGTAKSSGAFSTLFRSRLVRAIDYRNTPVELSDDGIRRVVHVAPAFSGRVQLEFPANGSFSSGTIYLSCRDASALDLPDQSIDLVVTDPPFFDNVHYSELADFFYAWQQLTPRGFVRAPGTTRRANEVQDTNSERFADKLGAVLAEVRRVLKDDGLLVFSYHHSKNEAWNSVATAILRGGFFVVNSQPVKAEMSVAAPKTQAKEPIQLDILVVCRKRLRADLFPSIDNALRAAATKISRLEQCAFKLSLNDRRVILFGQLLATIRDESAAAEIGNVLDREFGKLERTDRYAIPQSSAAPANLELFGTHE